MLLSFLKLLGKLSGLHPELLGSIPRGSTLALLANLNWQRSGLLNRRCGIVAHASNLGNGGRFVYSLSQVYAEEIARASAFEHFPFNTGG